MTPQEIIDVVTAFRDGKEIECKEKRYNGNWSANNAPQWDFSMFNYRIKSQPKFRPWKPCEVPVGALNRNKSNPNHVSMIVGYTPDYIVDSSNPQLGGKPFETYQYANENNEHSTDGGKTWKPCGVLVEE